MGTPRGNLALQMAASLIKAQVWIDDIVCTKSRSLPMSLMHLPATDHKWKYLYSVSRRALQFWQLTYIHGAHGSLVVKALSYKPEGRGFENDEMKF
jgi:hypothetical protein